MISINYLVLLIIVSFLIHLQHKKQKLQNTFERFENPIPNEKEMKSEQVQNLKSNVDSVFNAQNNQLKQSDNPKVDILSLEKEIMTKYNCKAGPTNFKNPSEMTTDELNNFKNIKVFSTMTIQDYKNWLMLFKDEFFKLPDIHLNNLKRLLRGGTIQVEDIPDTTHVDNLGIPLIEDDFYTNRKSNNLPYVGYNYDAYTEKMNMNEFRGKEIIPKQDKKNPQEINKFLYSLL